MTPALEVHDLDVLFSLGHDRANPVARRLIGSRSFDEPRGFRVGLADVNFSVESGQCLAVLGASGAGKSSLLRTLAGLHPLRRGRVLAKGTDVTARPPEQRSIVYLHQEPVLFPHLPVFMNVAFPLLLRGVPKRDATRRAFEWLDKLHVGNVSGNMPDALSGGQRHRVALARALCADPAVLLLDEPLASLDPAVRRDVRDALLEARAASGAAMVLVTHDLDDAMAVATHIAAIEPFGSLTTAVAPALMLDQPPSLHTARLLGVYSELSGAVSSSGTGPWFGWIGGSIPVHDVPDGPAVAFVRSHELAVEPGTRTDAPRLVIRARSDGAHDVSLTVSDASGGAVTLRTDGGTAVSVGDAVQITVRRARFFSSH